MILVRAPGLFTTVQDLGRPGYGPLGVSTSGAADPIALRIGNRLVSNPEGAAALEMTLLGGTFEFDLDTRLALTGSDFAASIGQRPCPLWTTVSVHRGETLKIGPTRSGARCYLCVAGGFSVPLFLQSASTHVLSGLGGFEGRPLRKGDVLRIGECPSLPRLVQVNPDILTLLAPRKLLRVTPGSQWESFPEAARTLLFSDVYQVTEESNRMGLRLQGAALESNLKGHMITEGVPLGAIQIPAGGQPIILFVEQQTTGGYPKVANVIAADLPSIGQLRPRDQIRFELVTPQAARELICAQAELLKSPTLLIPL